MSEEQLARLEDVEKSLEAAIVMLNKALQDIHDRILRLEQNLNV